MPVILIWAIVLTTVALCLYTVSIFRVRHQELIKKGSLVGLTIAWLCDFTGTILFYCLSKTVHMALNTDAPIFIFHIWFGYVVLIMMLILLIWMFKQYRQDANNPGRIMLNYALLSWILWLIEYLTGMLVH